MHRACRQDGQNKAEELRKKDLRAELEEKERKHLLKTKGHNFEGGHEMPFGTGSRVELSWMQGARPLGTRRPHNSLQPRCASFIPPPAAEREEDLRLLESAAQSHTAEPPRLVPRAADADDADADDADEDPESSSESEDDDDVRRGGRCQR